MLCETQLFWVHASYGEYEKLLFNSLKNSKPSVSAFTLLLSLLFSTFIKQAHNKDDGCHTIRFKINVFFSLIF